MKRRYKKCTLSIAIHSMQMACMVCVGNMFIISCIWEHTCVLYHKFTLFWWQLILSRYVVRIMQLANFF